MASAKYVLQRINHSSRNVTAIIFFMTLIAFLIMNALKANASILFMTIFHLLPIVLLSISGMSFLSAAAFALLNNKKTKPKADKKSEYHIGSQSGHKYDTAHNTFKPAKPNKTAITASVLKPTIKYTLPSIIPCETTELREVLIGIEKILMDLTEDEYKLCIKVIENFTIALSQILQEDKYILKFYQKSNTDRSYDSDKSIDSRMKDTMKLAKNENKDNKLYAFAFLITRGILCNGDVLIQRAVQELLDESLNAASLSSLSKSIQDIFFNSIQRIESIFTKEKIYKKYLDILCTPVSVTSNEDSSSESDSENEHDKFLDNIDSYMREQGVPQL